MTFSITSGRIPSSRHAGYCAAPQKSCKRHAGITALAPRSFFAMASIAASRRALVRVPQPDTDVVPVVVKMRGLSGFAFTLAISSRAKGARHTMCALPFFVRPPGRCHVPSSCSWSRVHAGDFVPPLAGQQQQLGRGPIRTDAQRQEPTARRPDLHATQNHLISSAVNTRSRASGPVGRCTPAHGLLSTRR